MTSHLKNHVVTLLIAPKLPYAPKSLFLNLWVFYELWGSLKLWLEWPPRQRQLHLQHCQTATPQDQDLQLLYLVVPTQITYRIWSTCFQTSSWNSTIFENQSLCKTRLARNHQHWWSLNALACIMASCVCIVVWLVVSSDSKMDVMQKLIEGDEAA